MSAGHAVRLSFQRLEHLREFGLVHGLEAWEGRWRQLRLGRGLLRLLSNLRPLPCVGLGALVIGLAAAEAGGAGELGVVLPHCVDAGLAEGAQGTPGVTAKGDRVAVVVGDQAVPV